MPFGRPPTPETPNLRKNALRAVLEHGKDDNRTVEAVGNYFAELERAAEGQGLLRDALLMLTQAEFYIDAGMKRHAEETLDTAREYLPSMLDGAGETNANSDITNRYDALRSRLENPPAAN